MVASPLGWSREATVTPWGILGISRILDALPGRPYEGVVGGV